MRELLHFDLDGVEYGIWKDEILSLKNNVSIHHLPLVHKYIAGITIIDDRVVTLADLSVCVGLPFIKHVMEYHMLVLSEEYDIAGFVIGGEIGHYKISTDEIFPVSKILQTSLIDTCILHASKPIPVINISVLYNIVRKMDYEPGEFDLPGTGINKIDISSAKGFRIIECAGESFALPYCDPEEKTLEPGGISSLILIPEYARGIVFHNGSFIPLINLSRRIKLDGEGTNDLMLVASIDGNDVGILIDSDKGNSNDKVITRSLPPLVQTGWMRDAVVKNEEIIPIIDPFVLVTAGHDDKYGIPLPARYNPDSKFESMIGREEVEVIEFTILGVLHALPKSEVVDSFSFKPPRRAPNVLPIVMGIIEHEGELLPALDPAACFGRRSPVTDQWKMALIRNGDFRAFVVTENVAGTRLIPVNLQHELPIDLPHRIVYGCYPDTDTGAVRLIFNIEAMAVHFDSFSVKDFSHVFSGGVESLPGIEQAGIKNEGIEEEYAISKTEVEIHDPVEYTESHGPVEPVKSVESGDSAVLPQEFLDGGESGEIQEEHEKSRQEQDSTAEPDVGIEFQSIDDIEREDESKIIEVDAPGASKTEVSKVEVSNEDEDEGEAEHEKEVEPSESAESLNLDEVLNPKDYFEDIPEEDTDIIDILKSMEKNEGKENEEETEEEELAISGGKDADKEQVITEAHEDIRDKTAYTGDKIEMPETQDDAEPESTSSIHSKDSASEMRDTSRTIINAGLPQGHSEKDVSRWSNRRYLYAASAVLLAAMLYFVNMFTQKKVERAEEEKFENIAPLEYSNKADVNKQQLSSRKQPGQAETSEDKKVSNQSGAQSDSGKSGDYVVHEVMRGDTLYEITEKITGNGFDYHDVARENNINNPDVIFPRQKINIKKKY